MAKLKLEQLFDVDIVPKNIAGSSKAIDAKALKVVVDRYRQYDNDRVYTRGGEQINITEQWNQRYRMYKAIYNQQDHSYEGKAKVFMPAARRSVNVIESEATNALFGRDDYFAVEPIAKTPDNLDMSRKAYHVLKFFSDKEGYVDEYELCLKQALIYDHTACENVILKEHVEGLFRKLDEVPVLDEETKDPLVDPKTGAPITRKEYNIYEIKEEQQTVRIECRDIFRMYINHQSNTPEDEDMIYRDSLTTQELLKMGERGLYNQAAVKRLLDQAPTIEASNTENTYDDGEGKPRLDDIKTFGSGKNTKEAMKYEVLRFQGLFTTENEDSGERIQEQYWIDIGEQKEVLQIRKNPLLGKYKTFSVTNYDTMPNEFYSDSVISPIIGIQTEINDKENQSLDGVGFELNAPFEVKKSSGIKSSDIIAARKKPNKAIFVKEMGSINKLTTNPPLAHLNTELNRLNATIDSTTGATSLASGAPTGTQADRSGKALGILSAQTRSQFSKFVRKFERQFLQRSLQKSWDMIVQFFDDTIEIEILGEDNKATIHAQPIAEIVGRFNVKVVGGSQFFKERERRDSIMEFLSIASIDDTFSKVLDKPAMMKAIAAAMPFNMEQFVDPNNLITQMQALIENLNKTLEASGVRNKGLTDEVNRLVGVIKQTDKAQEASPPVTDVAGQAVQDQARQSAGAVQNRVQGAIGANVTA